MPLNVRDLYFHIPSQKIDEIEKSNESYSFDLQTEQDKLILQQLNEDADLLLPVTSDGKRITDIDSLSQISNPVGRDMLLSRMMQNGHSDIDNTGLTDEEIAANVIPKDASFSDTFNMVRDLEDYVNEGAQLDAENAAALAAAAAQPLQPSDNQPITE